MGSVGPESPLSPSQEGGLLLSPTLEMPLMMMETLATSETSASVLTEHTEGTIATETTTGTDQEIWKTLEATVLSYGDMEALDSSLNYARSVHKTSGLFNQSESLRESLKLDLFADVECEDLLMTCMKQTVLKESTDSDALEMGASGNFNDDWSMDTDFLDGFADLSKYIEEDTMMSDKQTISAEALIADQSLTAPDNVSMETNNISQSGGSFDTVDLAILSAEGDHNIGSPDSNSIEDHDYSRCKKRKLDSVTSDDVNKKRRTAESMTSESDTESVATTASDSHDKYGERRRKNNVASKRSREQRKNKYVLMEEEAVRLEKENADMQAKIELLEKATKDLKQMLVQRLSSGSK